MTIKTVIVIRRDLELPTGKWIAQASHALMRATCEWKVDNPYLTDDLPVCIVCSIKNESRLLSLFQKMQKAGVRCGLQRDAGHNFVVADTPTVLCIGPAPAEVIDPLTKKLQLYKG